MPLIYCYNTYLITILMKHLLTKVLIPKLYQGITKSQYKSNVQKLRKKSVGWFALFFFSFFFFSSI